MSGRRAFKLAAGFCTAAVLVFAGVFVYRNTENKKDTQDDRSLDLVLESNELIIGLDTEFPPMGFVNESGEIVGFDIDLAQEVCDRLGVELVKQPLDWDYKEEYLYTGAIDCIWNGFSVTPERAAEMNLSDPYLKNTLIFVVTEQSTIKNMSDLKGKTVGVQSGSSAKEALEESYLASDINIRFFDDNLEMTNELKNNGIDAAFFDSIMAYYFLLSDNEQYYVLPDSLGEEEIAVAFRNDDYSLRNKVQDILYEMKSDGTLAEISKKWFGCDITIVR